MSSHQKLWEAFVLARFHAHYDPPSGLRYMHRKVADLNITDDKGDPIPINPFHMYTELTRWVQDKQITHDDHTDFASEYPIERIAALTTQENVTSAPGSCADLAKTLGDIAKRVMDEEQQRLANYHAKYAEWATKDPEKRKNEYLVQNYECQNACAVGSYGKCDGCCGRETGDQYAYKSQKTNWINSLIVECSLYGGSQFNQDVADWKALEPRMDPEPQIPPIQVGACMDCGINTNVTGSNDLLNNLNIVTNCVANVSQTAAPVPTAPVVTTQTEPETKKLSFMNTPVFPQYPRFTWMYMLLLMVVSVAVAVLVDVRKKATPSRKAIPAQVLPGPPV